MQKTDWELYTSSEEAWEAMLSAVRTAEHSIDIEQYIFTTDAIGQRFINELLAARRRGVQIRILCDSVGSEGVVFDGFDEKPLLDAGIEVQFFNPIRYWKFWKLLYFWSWYLRDHSKIMIVDGRVGYTGGVGIRMDMSAWRDSHVRIEGPVVTVMSEAFTRMWSQVKAGRRLIGNRAHVIPDSAFQFLMNYPKPRQRYIYYEFLRAIKSATKYIYLSTPYFIPTTRFSRALKRAVKRGVDVRLIVPAQSDAFAVDLATQSYFTIGLKAGFTIFQYIPGMIHNKIAVIDDAWASVGSSNLDNLSFLLNYEGNIFSTDLDFISALKEQFHDLFSQSRRLTLADWKARPWYRKFLEILTWPFHRIL
jgi:cardiolipin synthase